MVDSRRARSRKSTADAKCLGQTGSATRSTPSSGDDDGTLPTAATARRQRAHGVSKSDIFSPPPIEEECVMESGHESEINSLLNVRFGKRKRDHSSHSNTRSAIRNTESFQFFKHLVSDLFNDEDAVEFRVPVLKKYRASEVPNYRKLIKHPMDLGTIKKNISTDVYVCENPDGTYSFDEEQCLDDLRLVFNNCIMYNEATSDLHKAALAFLNFVNSRVQERSSRTQRAKRAKSKHKPAHQRRKVVDIETTDESLHAADMALKLEKTKKPTKEPERRRDEDIKRLESEWKARVKEEREKAMHDVISHGQSQQGVASSNATSFASPAGSNDLPASSYLLQTPSTTMKAATTTEQLDNGAQVASIIASQDAPHAVSKLPQIATQGLEAFTQTQSQSSPQGFAHSLTVGASGLKTQMGRPPVNRAFQPSQRKPASRPLAGGVPRMMQRVAPSRTVEEATASSQTATPATTEAAALSCAPGTTSVPVTAIDSSALPGVPYLIPGVGAPINAHVASASMPASDTRPSRKVDSETTGNREKASNDDGKADLANSASSEEEEDDDEEDMDLQNGDITFTFVSTEGMEKKRGRKSVRVMELEGKHDNLMKQRKVMVELCAELEKRRQVQMTFVEKKKLCDEVAALDYVRMKGVVDILACGMSRPDFFNEVEIDLDIESVDNAVLREIQYFLRNPTAMTARESLRQVETQVAGIEQELVDLRYQKMASVLG